MTLRALSLSDDELRALREMPEFQKQLKKIRKLREKAETERHRASGSCPGAEPVATPEGYRCPKCQLLVPYGNDNANHNHKILMRGQHWNHAGNPFTSNGMYGKAAGGDWYMDH